MLKSLMTFCLLLALLAPAYSQHNKRDSVAQYYALKNKAELAIMDSNYTEALRLYDLAFAYKRPNARELYNAMVAAYSQRDTQRFRQYYNATILKGQTKKVFEASKFFGQLIVDDPLYKSVAKNYDSLHAIAERSAMPRLAIMMDTILRRDQRVRSADSRAIRRVDSANRVLMASFIDTHGFPGFELLGYYDPQLWGQPRNFTTFWMLMWHARYSYVPLDSYALKAVLEGDLPPDDYALLMDTKSDDVVYFEIPPRQVADNKIVDQAPDDEDKINKKRAEIFLDNLSDFKKKLEFMETGDKRFQFIPVMVQSLNAISNAQVNKPN